MIKRLNVKKNVRLLSVQWDGANISECVGFCRYCHFSDGWMFITFRENIIRLNKGDWIIALTDKELLLLIMKHINIFLINRKMLKTVANKRDKWACNLLPHRVSEARRAELSMLQL